MLHLDFQRRGDEFPEVGVEQTSNLVAAAWHGWVGEIERHCKAGGITTEDRDWAVYLAVQQNRPDALVALVDKCPDINIPARRIPGEDHGPVLDHGPLWTAATKGFHLMAKVLLQAGADPNRARASGGETPIAMASQSGFADTVAMLLQAGADPNRVRPEDGATPIYQASENGHTATVEVLLRNGANPNVATTDGRDYTPLKIANQKRHAEVVALLCAAGAKQ